MTDVYSRHENKPNPAPIPYSKIVEAYGLRKCPKLVEQVADDNIEVRINALAVLCDEFNNPYSIYGCAKAGVVKVLASMVTDPDYTTRDRASLALAIAARDANGLTAILEDEAIPDILQGINDPTISVRAQVYECLFHSTRTTDGVYACVNAGVTKEFVAAVSNEDDELKSMILRTLHNLFQVELGLTDALESGAVKVLIELLANDLPDVKVQAARALGFLCFADSAKDDAIDTGAVTGLVSLLRDPLIEVRAAATLALMAVTSTDEGKRQILPCGGVPILIDLLSDRDRIVRLNTLKVLSNVSVYPTVRELLKSDEDCVVRLTNLCSCGDALTEKHAKIALEATNWQP